MHKDNDAYLEAAGQYYELSEIMEKEKQAMIANMLDVRESLERANKKRREMEEANIRLLEKSETDALTRLARSWISIILSSIMITTDIRQGMSALSGSQSSLS